MRFSAIPNKLFLDVTAIGLLLAFFFGFGLGDRLYSAPSESRYVEIGREMAQSGDFVTPRLDYVKYFEKPPLFYWIQAESTRLFGFAPFAARVPTAAFALLLCLLTYCLTRMLYGRLAGWLGAGVLASCLYMFALSRIVLLDVPVSFFMCAALSAFLYAAYAPPSRKRTLVIYAMYLAAAGAVLTKGLIGAVLPGAVIFLWLAFTRNWLLLRQMRLVSGTVLFLVISAPWHLLVAARNPEWAHFYFIHEHFERYLTKEAGRYKPFWFFAAMTIGGLFPWTVYLWQSARAALGGFWRDRMQDGRPLFLVLWVVFILLFFSLSDSKLPAYILPIFPPLAAVIGAYFARAWRQQSAPGFTAGFWLFILFLLALAVVPSLSIGSMDRDNKIAVAMLQGGDELRYLSFAAMVGAGLLLVVHIQAHKRHVILAMLAVAAIVAQLGDQVGAHYNKDSMESFSQVIRAMHQPGDETAMYQVYYQDMPLYLNERVTLADWKGELEFGSQHENVSAWMMDAPAFWKRWMKNDHRMFLVMRNDAVERLVKTGPLESLHLYPLQADGRNRLFINRLPEKQPAKGH